MYFLKHQSMEHKISYKKVLTHLYRKTISLKDIAKIKNFLEVDLLSYHVLLIQNPVFDQKFFFGRGNFDINTFC